MIADSAYTRGFRVGTIVRHFKGGLYQIIAFAKHTETGEPLVVYQQLYSPFMVFCRPEKMFCSPVDKSKYPNAEDYYRFDFHFPVPAGTEGGEV